MLTLVAAESDDNAGVFDSEKVKMVARQHNGVFYFYGILLDQTNNPIPDAVVTLSASTFSALGARIDSSTNKHRATTDVRGAFSFTDINGYMFYLASIEKPGYRFVLRPYAYNYTSPGTPFREDISAPDHPCVVPGWRTAPNEEVAPFEKGTNVDDVRLMMQSVADLNRQMRFRIELVDDPAENPEHTWNARVVPVSISDETADWDLEISMDGMAGMPLPQTRKQMRLASWLPPGSAVRVRANHGGVQQADWRYPYLAPDHGYLESAVLKWNNGESDGGDLIRFAVYYFNKRTSRYAHLYIDYKSEFGRAEPPSIGGKVEVVKITLPFVGNNGEPPGVLNPHGSRVLEYSRAYNNQQIEQRMKPIRDKEQADRDARRETKLDWFRKNDPNEAWLIEERMRSQGKVVPPPKE